MYQEAPSPLVLYGFPVLALAVSGLFVAAVGVTARSRRAAVLAALGVTAVLGVTGALAASGVLRDGTRRPPPMMLLLVGLVVLTVTVARSRTGDRIATGLPLFALVGAQAFRLPLELVMHHAATEGLMPPQMSFSGYNFDIVTGGTALLLSVLLATREVPRTVVLAWNVMGSTLLLVVVGIAIASMPWTAAFGEERVAEFVLHFPYVWLPGILVPAALFGHLTIFRRLLRASGAVSGSRSPGSPGTEPPRLAGRAG